MTATLVNKELPPEVERLSHTVIGCAIEVHRELGPGLLESLYEEALAHELALAGVPSERQVEIEVPYKGIILKGHRLDLVVDNTIVVEMKSISKLQDVHSAQLLSYLRAAALPLGLLLNFNVTLLKDGLIRVFNERILSEHALSASTSRSSRPSRSNPC